MNEKTKLFVFTRLEVFLFFIFVVLIAATSLIVGFNIGKKYSLKRDGFTIGDGQKVELMSGQEEAVEQIVAEKEAEAEDEGVDGDKQQEKKEVLDKTYSRLSEEVQKLSKDKKEETLKAEFIPSSAKTANSVTSAKSATLLQGGTKTEVDPNVINTGAVAVDKKTLEVLKKQEDLAGKFTVQLAAYRSLRDAEDFADGFRVRGYNPIISEGVKNGETWYRVSLGVFDNIGQTKDYINKEKSLLRGTDYLIRRFE